MTLVCLSSANCLWAFLCIIFRRGFLLGRQPCRPIWCSVRRMVWALTGWPPHPFQPLQQCWQHSYIYFPNTTSGYDTEHVHLTSLVNHGEACSEWNRPVKLLYDLSHRAAAQFQRLGNLLIAYAIFMQSKNIFFSDRQRVLCHEVPCWTSSDQYERVRAIIPD